MLFWVLVSVSILSLFFLIRTLYKASHAYFEQKGIKYVSQSTVFMETVRHFFNFDVQDVLLYCYNKYPGEKLIGTFQALTPVFYVKSPEALKKIAIKDFSHFQDRSQTIGTNVDEFFGSTLLAMNGKQWREMRISLTPAFTGSKMRQMLQFINKCAQQFTDHIYDEYNQEGGKPYEVKKIIAKYTNDVIASCAFGVECNSLKNPENDIYIIGQDFQALQKPLRLMKFLFIYTFPKLSKLLGLEAFSKKHEKKFREIIIETMEVREKEGIVRPDMINILMNLRKASKPNEDCPSDAQAEVKRSWTEIELIAQCFLFFLAGFEASATMMSFAAYELAVNPDVQERLRAEIDETAEALNGQPLTYEALQQMKYLDMVISEVLRKWPTNIIADRKCVQDYDYEDEDGHRFTIEKDSIVWIPIVGFHMDAKHFPQPEKFDPDRFSEENSGSINRDAYLPFGVGPRNCIGSRFALMEAKALFYHILLKLKIVVCKETQVPLKLKKSVLPMIPEKPITLKFEPRDI